MMQNEIIMIIKTQDDKQFEVDNMFFNNCKTLKLISQQMEKYYIEINYDLKHFQTLQSFLKLSGEKQRDLIYQNDPRDLCTLINLTEFLNCKLIHELLCERVAEITQELDDESIKRKLGLL